MQFISTLHIYLISLSVHYEQILCDIDTSMPIFQMRKCGLHSWISYIAIPRSPSW